MLCFLQCFNNKSLRVSALHDSPNAMALGKKHLTFLNGR